MEFLKSAAVQPSHQCNCIGPQNGQPLCPCEMRSVIIENGRYVKPVDLGPVKEKMLAQWEQSAQVLGITDGQEIIRNARRYLALRESGNFSAGMGGFMWGLRMSSKPLTSVERISLDCSADTMIDAAADRLLEGGE